MLTNTRLNSLRHLYIHNISLAICNLHLSKSGTPFANLHNQINPHIPIKIHNFMAEFPINLQSSKLQPCFYEVDPMGIMNQIPELNPNLMENQTFNFNNFNPMSFFNENFLCNNQVSEFPGNLAETFPGLLHASQQNSTMIDTHGRDVVKDESVECKKRKVLGGQEGSSSTSSPVVSETGSNRKIVSI